MSLQSSVTIRQFSQYCTLSTEDKEILLSLEQYPIRVSVGQTIWPEGAQPDQFFTVREGWAFSFRTLDDGSRQILKIYLPGDIIGMRDFSFSQRLAGVAMITSWRALPFQPSAATLDLSPFGEPDGWLLRDC